MRRAIITIAALGILAAWGCGDSNPEPVLQADPPAPEQDNVQYLDPVQHLIRASVDLRGVRPTIQEIEYIEKHPDKMRDKVRAYMEDPRFHKRVKEVWNRAFLVNRDRPFFPGPPELVGLKTEDDFARASNQETLELVAHIVTTDKPFTEIVLADYTVANKTLASYYDIKRGGWPDDMWVEAHYDDGRPMAGVLSTNSMPTRWTTTNSNKNRGRANSWTRSILCYDFLKRDVDLATDSIDLTDPNAINTAIRTNPACMSCHQSLDPFASYFFGYFIPETPDNGDAERSYPIKTYSESMEPRWQQATNRRPGYFGYNAGERLDALGEEIAEDPRFSMCAVQRFESALKGVYMEDLDLFESDRLHDYFMATEYDMKAVVEEIVMSPDYRIAGPKDDTADYVVGLKLLHPEKLHDTLNDLTGFEWKLDAPLGYNLLENDIYGFRMMSGGYDSDFVTAPATTVNATTILTLRMAAADAAGRVVENEMAMEPGQRRLLTKINGDETDHESIRAQGVALHKMLYGEVHDPADQEITDMLELWLKVYERTDDTEYAWKVTLTALFSDIRIVFY